MAYFPLQGQYDMDILQLGGFFGLKLHLVINDRGDLMAFKMTSGNRHDSKEAVPLPNGKLKGIAFGDKGYLGKRIFDELFEAGIKLITRSRKNMKNKPLISRIERNILNQRGMIETVIGHIKLSFQVWHPRHRSIMNALTHLIAAMAAYTMKPLQLGAIKMLAICSK